MKHHIKECIRAMSLAGGIVFLAQGICNDSTWRLLLGAMLIGGFYALLDIQIEEKK